MLHLPPELVLLILSHLDISLILELSQLSNDWKSFIDDHSSSIYHDQCVSHQLIPSSSFLYSRLPSLYSPRSLAGVTTWKSFFERRVQISKSWRAGPSSPSRYVSWPNTGISVHRIKVDEQAGFIVVSFHDGGLRVVDLGTNVVLWSLSDHYVKPYAHLEYDRGFLVFDRMDGSKEVWRLAKDCPQAGPSVEDDQLEASNQAAQNHVNGDKGHFVPWAVLQMPSPTRAFRFVYPTLLVGASDNAFLFDIPSGRLVQTITEIQQPEDPAATNNSPFPRLPPLHGINYVDLSPTHVFVCGFSALRVFSRATGKCTLNIPSTKLNRHGIWGATKYRILPVEDADQSGMEQIESALVKHPTRMWIFNKEQVMGGPEVSRLIDRFVAAHVSSCGKHLVGMLSTAKIVLIRDFDSSDASTLYDRTTLIQLGPAFKSSVYLAVHGDRVAVATKTGVFVFSLSAALSPSSTVESQYSPSSHPFSVLSEPPSTFTIGLTTLFLDPWYIDHISCLQLSDTQLYLNWDAPSLRGLVGPSLNVNIGTGRPADEQQTAEEMQGDGHTDWGNLQYAAELGPQSLADAQHEQLGRLQSGLRQDLGVDMEFVEYFRLAGGHLAVAVQAAEDHDEWPRSVVCGIDFAPPPPTASAVAL